MLVPVAVGVDVGVALNDTVVLAVAAKLGVIVAVELPAAMLNVGVTVVKFVPEMETEPDTAPAV